MESSSTVRDLGSTVKTNGVSNACEVARTGHTGFKATVGEDRCIRREDVILCV